VEIFVEEGKRCEQEGMEIGKRKKKKREKKSTKKGKKSVLPQQS